MCYNLERENEKGYMTMSNVAMFGMLGILALILFVVIVVVVITLNYKSVFQVVSMMKAKNSKDRNQEYQQRESVHLHGFCCILEGNGEKL